jgi:hypothetical protein
MAQAAPGGQIRGPVQDSKSVVAGRSVREQHMAMRSLQPHPLQGRFQRGGIPGDTDETRRLGQLAGPAEGQREFLVRDRPVVVLAQILELADRSGNDLSGVIVVARPCPLRSPPTPGSGPVAPAEPLVDSSDSY